MQRAVVTVLSLVRVAAHPRAVTRHVACAIEVPEREVSRPTGDGLLVLVTDGATPVLRPYRLPS